MESLTTVNACAATGCAYNNGGCSAGAITVAGSPESASCGTFVQLDARGGVAKASGKVGACQRLECVHNADLMCSADGITVDDTATCTSYQVTTA